jgi:hypothetical protein
MAFEHSSEDRGTWFKYPDQGAEKIKFLPMTFCRAHVISPFWRSYS